jgi:hypothetical protein
MRTTLNSLQPRGFRLIVRNVRRPDDGSRCDLLRSARGHYITMIGDVVRSISQEDARRILAPVKRKVG